MDIFHFWIFPSYFRYYLFLKNPFLDPEAKTFLPMWDQSAEASAKRKVILNLIGHLTCFLFLFSPSSIFLIQFCVTSNIYKWLSLNTHVPDEVVVQRLILCLLKFHIVPTFQRRNWHNGPNEEQISILFFVRLIIKLLIGVVHLILVNLFLFQDAFSLSRTLSALSVGILVVRSDLVI